MTLHYVLDIFTFLFSYVLFINMIYSNLHVIFFTIHISHDLYIFTFDFFTTIIPFDMIFYDTFIVTCHFFHVFYMSWFFYFHI